METMPQVLVANPGPIGMTLLIVVSKREIHLAVDVDHFHHHSLNYCRHVSITNFLSANSRLIDLAGAVRAAGAG